jgi:biotin--protein ligase
VRGTILACYDYKIESGARAAKILGKNFPQLQKNPYFTVYYNGGGCFVDADQKDNTTILACYDTEKQEAAIVECVIGTGKAILSGVHFEYDPNLMDAGNEYLRYIIPMIKDENSQRVLLVLHLLKRLNLKSDSSPTLLIQL